MKINPTYMFTILAVVAVAAVAGLTRDRWMPAEPAAVAEVEISKTEPPATAEVPAVPEAPAAAATEPVTEVAAAPKTEAPATPEAPAIVEPPKVEAAAPAATTAAPQDTAAAAPEAVAAIVPSFDTVRVEKTGEALIAGRAAAGSEVTVKLDGKFVGTAMANADGAFVVTTDSPLPPGSGALTIESKKSNETVVRKSEQTVAVIVPAVEAKQDALVAVISPDQPTKVLQKSQPVVEAPETEAAADIVAEQPAAPTKVAAATPLSLDAVDYDDAGNIIFSGRNAAGATARLYVDNKIAGDVRADDTGRWTFAGSAPIASGKHTLRVDGIDAAGAVVGRVELPFFREEQTKVAAAVPEQPAAQTAEPATTTTETEVAATAVVPDVPKPKDGRVVIQPGNNLWRISRVIYGSGTKFTVLYEANKDQIKDPDLIYPGQVFMTPNVVPPETIDPRSREPLKLDEGAAAVQ